MNQDSAGLAGKPAHDLVGAAVFGARYLIGQMAGWHCLGDEDFADEIDHLPEPAGAAAALSFCLEAGFLPPDEEAIAQVLFDLISQRSAFEADSTAPEYSFEAACQQLAAEPF